MSLILHKNHKSITKCRENIHKGMNKSSVINYTINQMPREKKKSNFLFIHILFFRVHYIVRNSSLVVVDVFVSCDLQAKKNIENFFV